MVLTFYTPSSVSILSKVIEGMRPPLPTSSSRSYNDLMEACWAGDVAARPTFVSIVAALKDVRKETASGAAMTTVEELTNTAV